MSASIWVQRGPAMTREKSTTRIPLSGGQPDFAMPEK
jgi:hypothetical protein